MYCSASATLRIKSSCLIVAITNCLHDDSATAFYLRSSISGSTVLRERRPSVNSAQNKTGAARSLSPHPFKTNCLLLDLSEAIHNTDIDAKVVLDRALRPVR